MISAIDSTFVNHLRTFTDKNTGREIRQLTNLPKGAYLGYFRFPKTMPDGRLLASARHDHGNLILIDPDSGDLQLLPHAGWLRLREVDGRLWYLAHRDGQSLRGRKRSTPPNELQLWHVDLPDGDPVMDADLPEDLPGSVVDITADGRHLILDERNDPLANELMPTTCDVDAMTRYFQRERSGATWAYDITTGQSRCLVRTDAVTPFHHDASPTDPTLLRYALDMPESHGQRIWTIRIDGSDQHPIRPQLRGEVTTHEFWWSDPNYIGYTYQDRCGDPNAADHHWAEYTPAQTQIGIADLTGKEIYLSDPINCYHSHLYRSSDGRFVSGEGTDGCSFVHAAAFDFNTTQLDMIPLATIHSHYVPFRGQDVDCNFSADGRHLIYADRPDPDQPRQLYAVAVDL